MKYGYFDDQNYEYVITNYNTPLPWINFYGQDGFFSLMSNTCGGYMFYQDARLRRITRYRYNNVPRDNNGRYYYIKDGKTVWNVGYLPTKTKLNSYKCRHGLGYSIFESKKNDLKAELTCFVPLKDPVEINMLTLTNESKKAKTITLHSFIEWCLYDAMDDMSNFQRNFNTGEVEVDKNTIYHKTEYRERRNHFAYNYANVAHSAFDTDLDTFIGLHNSLENPEVVANGKCHNSIAQGWSPVAVHQFDLTLKPGESKTIIFQTGYVENNPKKKFKGKNIIRKDNALKLINKYKSVKDVNLAFTQLVNQWKSLLSKFTVKTGDEKLDRMVNIWNQYQCMVTFNLSRSASYYESGIGRGMGFRDSCQDLYGFLHLIPDKSKQRIIDIASIQFKDGSTYHQYQPLTKRGNANIGGGFNDDPLWLVGSVAQYLKETGDYSILNTKVPYNNKKGSEEPLFNHIKASIDYIITHKGPNKLPLIGHADWNDCLNLNCFSENPGESFQIHEGKTNSRAESVFIAGMFVYYAKEYVNICKHIKKLGEATRVEKEIKNMEQAVIKRGWDGNWFRRAYDYFNKPIGSKKNKEGKIYIEPQGFCTMAEIGKDKKLGEKALASVEKYLTSDFGVELLYPTYTEYHLEIGEITSYPPGFKENGSIFCHNNAWIVVAYATIKNGDKAFDIYKRIAPAYLEDKSEIHKTEPYVYSQTIAGRQAGTHFGEAKNSFLTGTASWSFVSISQAILGIIPDYDGLKIDPCLPSSLKEIEVTRVYRGVTYKIKIHHNKKPYQLMVNGKVVNSKIIPAIKKAKIVNVEVNC